MLIMTRRWFLKAIMAFGLSSLFPGISSSTASEEPLFYKNMEALTDTIMPGAVELGIHEDVKRKVFSGPNITTISTVGLDFLQHYSKKEYGKSFYMLDENQKNAVLRSMEDMQRDKTVEFFFKKYRETVLSYYYTNPEVWKTLRYNGPPQPRGFMDYHLPPGGKKDE